MSAVTLTRTDAARNMKRFYKLDTQPDLFGAWCYIRRARVGGRGGKIDIRCVLPLTVDCRRIPEPPRPALYAPCIASPAASAAPPVRR